MTFAIMGSNRAPGILDGRPAVEPNAVSSTAAETDFFRLLARTRISLGTSLDFHHVPSRLRLWGDAVKRDPATLGRLCRDFTAAPGVRWATSNCHTGSILIDYDPSVLLPEAVALALPESPSIGADDKAGLPSSAECLGAKLVEHFLAKFAVALIAAVV